MKRLSSYILLMLMITACNGTNTNNPAPTKTEKLKSMEYYITDVIPSSETVFYGVCDNNKPTAVTIEVSFRPDENLAELYLEYHYQLNENVRSEMTHLTMTKIGGGQGQAEINVREEAGGTLVSANGWIYYSVNFIDINGFHVMSDPDYPYSVEVEFCGVPQPEGP